MKLDEIFFTGIRPDVYISLEGTNTVHLGENVIGNLDVDKEAKSSLAFLLPLLDGSRVLKDIRQQAADINIAKNNIEECLQFLAENGCLYQHRDVADAGHAARYASRTFHPDIYLDRVAEAAVTIIGEGSLPDLLKEYYIAAGIGRVTSCAMGNHEQDNSPNLAVVYSLSQSAITTINSWSKRTNTPLLATWLNGEDLCFGPLVLPGKTACIDCFFSNVPEKDYFSNTQTPLHLPGIHLLAASAASLIAGLSQDFLSGFGLPEYFSTFNRFNLGSGCISSLKIFKNPRCPTCGRLHAMPEGTVVGV